VAIGIERPSRPRVATPHGHIPLCLLQGQFGIGITVRTGHRQPTRRGREPARNTCDENSPAEISAKTRHSSLFSNPVVTARFAMHIDGSYLLPCLAAPGHVMEAGNTVCRPMSANAQH
jgi:hypothetical protein